MYTAVETAGAALRTPVMVQTGGDAAEVGEEGARGRTLPLHVWLYTCRLAYCHPVSVVLVLMPDRDGGV